MVVNYCSVVNSEKHAIATDPTTASTTKPDTSSIVLGTDETDAQQILIYPNPTSGIINISSDILIDKIEVLDENSILHTIEPFEGNEINLSGLSAGIYYLRLYVGDEVVVRKISIIK